METNLISVIVPVYNNEKFLERCIQSVLNQSYKYIELILVNDGSTDNSGSICDKYSKNYDRVKVIHQVNSGVSVARNTGIINARGEYIQFLDSDDYLEANMCEKLYKSITKNSSDMVICGYIQNYRRKSIKQPCKNKVLLRFEDLSKEFKYLYENWLINCPWNKLYRREKIELLFKEDMSLAEDLFFNIDYISNCRGNISLISDCLYNYSIATENSLTSRYRDDLFQNIISSYNYVYKFCKHNLLQGDYEVGLNNILVQNLYGLLQNEVFNNEIKLLNKIKNIKIYLSDNTVRKALKNNTLRSFKYKIINYFEKHKVFMLVYIFFLSKKIIKNVYFTVYKNLKLLLKQIKKVRGM